MGQILDSLLGGDPVMQVDVDFQNATPRGENHEETDAVNEVNKFMTQGRPALHAIELYEGNGEVIRQAMSNSSNPEALEKAFDAIQPNITTIKTFYTLAQMLGPLVQRTVAFLGSSDHYLEQFTRYPALARALGELLVFIYDFDQHKMMKPDVQNDFSFYRRILPKMAGKRQPVVGETDAGLISMFIAQSVPLTHAVGFHLSQNGVDPLPLAKLANLCCGMLQRQTIHNPDVQILALKIMTTSIVLYDRAAFSGAFSNASPIKMRRCATAIARFGGAQTGSFRNSVKYASIHFNDPSTPDSLKAALGD